MSRPEVRRLEPPRVFTEYMRRAESSACVVCGAARDVPCGCRWCSGCDSYWQSDRLLQREHDLGPPHIRLGIAGETCPECVTVDEPIMQLAYGLAPHLHAFVEAAPVPEACCDRCGRALLDDAARVCTACGLLVCDACP